MSGSEGSFQARRFAVEVLEGRMTDRNIANRLMEMGKDGESPEDLVGMISVFYPPSKRISTKHPIVMDLCGTGGAPVRSFNVSTISSFVLASTHVPVAKHGNRSSLGRCGSADLLEAMGADISPDIERTERMLNDIDFAFLFAPVYHPAMRHVAKARKMVPGRTIFNIMGPLMNPVLGRRRQLIGVCAPELLDPVSQALISLNVDRALVVHGLPGMDEASMCGPTLVAQVDGDGVERYEITPEEFGLQRCLPEKVGELAPQASVRACNDILSGKRNERRDMVLLNSGCALYAFGSVPSIASGISLAEKAIDSGAAFAKVQEYVSASNYRSDE